MLKFSVQICLFFFIWSVWQCKPKQHDIETDFRISPADRVGRIEIYEHNILKQTLQQRSQRWWLNDSLKIRPDAMDNILRILPAIKVSFYPPKSAWENMIAAINQEGVRVVFKNHQGKEIKSWLIGGLTNDERGTYAMMEHSSQPYVIHVPGFEGSLASRFNMPDVEWRDRMIFEEIPTDILNVTVKYPSEPNQGFAVRYDPEAGMYQVYDWEGQKLISPRSQILAYLECYQRIGSEGIENDFQYKDLVLESKPHAVIEIDTKRRQGRRVAFFTMQAVGEESTDRMFVYDGRDFYLAQMRILQKLFRGKDYFLSK